MNSGGEPERDDTGLPPVDIEIPDDARELDRDVQAYFRELRAERRSQRRRRLHPGLSKDGVVLPLLACCLILALITGTLLTVFTATSDQNLVPPAAGRASPNKSALPASSPPASSSASPSAGGTTAGPAAGRGLTQTTAQLSDLRLAIPGGLLLPQGLPGILLVMIPRHCDCTVALTRLTRIGDGAGEGTVLVGTERTIAEAQRLQSQLNPRVSTNVWAGLDSQGVLQKAVPAVGLTAVVISSATTTSGAQPVAYASDLKSSDLSSSNGPLSVALVKALKG